MMKSLMQNLLGEHWQQLPPALQAHYGDGNTTDRGHLDVSFPPALQPLWWLLARMGALLDRRGEQLPTLVHKTRQGSLQNWQRIIRYPDGRQQRFDSVWQASQPGRLIEFVNPWLGLEMSATVKAGQLHYRGERFVLRCGQRHLGLPQWLLGYTSIVEKALDERHFAMDFRLTHPLLGEVFRYKGTFTTEQTNRH